jgi:hypothetical protein
MPSKKPTPGHFERGFGKPGWVYVARNDLHREDIYKIGYTEQTPEERVRKLNTEQKNRTSQIGFYQLVYAVAVLDSQGCEQALFKRIGRLLESSKKEFANAPLELIIGELLAIQKKDNASAVSRHECVGCGMVVSFCPLPQAKHSCPACRTEFQCNHKGAPNWRVSADARPIRYFSPGFTHEMRRHSPIAKAYLDLRGAVKNYLEGYWSDDDFFDVIDALIEVDVEFDRAQPAPKPPRHERKPTTRIPRSRKGWMDCPDCRSSVRVDPAGEIIYACPECGWSQEE